VIAGLRGAGMWDVPERFSVSLVHQTIPPGVLREIDAFCRTFDAVTTRADWRAEVLRDAPELARPLRREVCFFSAWDFHLPDDAGADFQLIEFNDNGSGLLYAALLNRCLFELTEREVGPSVEEPPLPAALNARILAAIRHEARSVFGALPQGLFLIVEDADSLAEGRFRDEQRMLCEALRADGLSAEIAALDALAWSGRRLLLGERRVDFVVNRSTDFFLEGEGAAALRAAYVRGDVYVAPNPASFATRSDKALLALLSSGEHDGRLGILPGERALLDRHVPETWRVGRENAAALAGRKHELVFKPARAFASHGLLRSEEIGRSRLERLVRRGEHYVAQRRVPKRRIAANDGDLWADLRVWSWRGERLALSGRASRRPDALDLRPPGGWLATYSGRDDDRA
jgi:hypothetical protein